MRARFDKKRASGCSLSLLSGSDTVKLVVGPGRKHFFIPRKLLASCHYFREQIDNARLDFADGQANLVIRLEGQCPDMFELFSYWLNERKGFDRYIDEAEVAGCCEELHWDLVNLHLFAAQIDLKALQDLAMDAIQDVYLRRNWDVNPKLVNYVYTDCGPEESYRLRKWIVAMIAWTLGGVDTDGIADKISLLLRECPGLKGEYREHLKKMAASRLETNFKNPQLRLPSNNLRNEERQFGFRQCSFHTHSYWEINLLWRPEVFVTRHPAPWACERRADKRKSRELLINDFGSQWARLKEARERNEAAIRLRCEKEKPAAMEPFESEHKAAHGPLCEMTACRLRRLLFQLKSALYSLAWLDKQREAELDRPHGEYEAKLDTLLREMDNTIGVNEEFEKCRWRVSCENIACARYVEVLAQLRRERPRQQEEDLDGRMHGDAQL
ncbi:Uu.00g015270.m01.CDS01 [Anthostomella pinea]|uniref:Uu.00g015270.m01.CDS01 n=1 Tax=Anthostomella pinea TaxID=933095 RepID=A0AAI8VZQ0_9PEZI|nr:Uu.00g015270.m01.CDS01 [Anthostomella pinea]